MPSGKSLVPCKASAKDSTKTHTVEIKIRIHVAVADLRVASRHRL